MRVGHLFIVVDLKRKQKFEAFIKIQPSFVAFQKEGRYKFILMDNESHAFANFEQNKVTYKKKPFPDDLPQTQKLYKYLSCVKLPPILITDDHLYVGL